VIDTAFLFPGQGAQRPGFLHALPAHPAARATLEEACDTLGTSAEALDSESALHATVAVQLGLLIAGVAAARALHAEGAEPDAVCGLSIGSFAAAVTCGTLAFRDALSLAKQRAEAMERAYPQGYGLAAITGLGEKQIARRIREVSTERDPVYIANVNAPRQIVIAGSDAALEALMSAVRGRGARKVQRLDVAVPSHCPLLNDAASQLVSAFAGIALGPPRIPYIDNRKGRALRSAEAIRDDLATNLAHPVRWHDATRVLCELGASLFVEMPPGRVLTDLASEAFPEVRAMAMEGASLEATTAMVHAHHAASEAR